MEVEKLIIVGCHAAFRASVTKIVNPILDEPWVLQDFQKGEPPFYVEHLQKGVEMASTDPRSLMIISGGYTREESEGRWSEANSYLEVAKHFGWWGHPEVSKRVALEEYARDSFENLLFSLCLFKIKAGKYPKRLEVVGWNFKERRFHLHREAIRFSLQRFSFAGINQPENLPAALQGEEKALLAFQKSRYGSEGELGAKRKKRNPRGRKIPYAREVPELTHFFEFIYNPANGNRDYPERLPWED